MKPKNWKSFQHYKQRNPAWIKLHRNLSTTLNFNVCRLLAGRCAMSLVASIRKAGREISLSLRSARFSGSECHRQNCKRR